MISLCIAPKKRTPNKLYIIHKILMVKRREIAPLYMNVFVCNIIKI